MRTQLERKVIHSFSNPNKHTIFFSLFPSPSFLRPFLFLLFFPFLLSLSSLFPALPFPSLLPHSQPRRISLEDQGGNGELEVSFATVLSRICRFSTSPSNPGSWNAESQGNQKPFLSSFGLDLQLFKSVQKSMGTFCALYFLKVARVELPAFAQGRVRVGCRVPKKNSQVQAEGLPVLAAIWLCI